MSDPSERKKQIVRVAEFRTKLSKYLEAAQKGTVVVIMNYDQPMAQLVPHTPETSGVQPEREATLLAPVYYAADGRFPQSSKIIAGVLSRADPDGKLAARVASMALNFERAAQRAKDNPPLAPEAGFVENSTQKLVTQEELQSISDDSWANYDEEFERKEQAFGAPPRKRSTVNSATKKK